MLKHEQAAIQLFIQQDLPRKEPCSRNSSISVLLELKCPDGRQMINKHYIYIYIDILSVRAGNKTYREKNAGSREGAAGGEAADVALEASLIR